MLVSFAASVVTAGPAHAAIDRVNPIPECMTPVSGGTGPGSTWDLVFGWEALGSGSVEIPAGPNNLVGGSGTVILGPATVFNNPATRPDGTLRHPVWPYGYEQRTGRTGWWTDPQLVVRVQWGQTATWSIRAPGDTQARTATEAAGANTQRCSQHLFLRKTWNGHLTPPANLDYRTYELRARMQANPTEPTVMNTGVARCRYQQIVSTPAGNPYGTAFVTPPVRSPDLKCVYENTGLPFGVDQSGLWIPRGGTYVVEESGLPPGWYPGRGIGAAQVIDFENPATVARCGYYPGFGTQVEVRDSDGSRIPMFGRASDKWCLQQVDNLSSPARISVTKSVSPSTATGWSFDFTIHPAPPSGPATRTATAAKPTVTWSGLFPDVRYTVTEHAKPGYVPGTIRCPGGGNSVHPPPGGTAACSVTNVARRSQPHLRTVTSHRRVTPGRPFYDRIHASRLAGAHGATAVARLYGPFRSRAAISCQPRFQVRSHTMRVHNGWNRTPRVQIGAPGLYTWRVRLLRNAANTSVTHPCGQIAETTTVAKRPYPAPDIDGGFSGTVDRSVAGRRVPMTIQMPGIGMRAPVRPEGVRHRHMTLPDRVGEVGWLRKSAGVGDKIGSVVVAGHVSDRHDRPGAMFNLGRAHAGQRVTVVEGGQRYRFKVTSSKTFDRRQRLPQRYVATTGRHRLVMVSCTGRVVYPNGHFHYTRYIVVVAKQV